MSDTAQQQASQDKPRARYTRPKKLTPTERADLVVRYMAGWDVKTLAAEAGVTIDQLRRWRDEERALIERIARQADAAQLPDLVRIRALLLQRMLACATTVDGATAAKMYEQIDARITAALSANAGPATSGNGAATGDLDRLVRSFLDATRPPTNGVVPK